MDMRIPQSHAPHRGTTTHPLICDISGHVEEVVDLRRNNWNKSKSGWKVHKGDQNLTEKVVKNEQQKPHSFLQVAYLWRPAGAPIPECDQSENCPKIPFIVICNWQLLTFCSLLLTFYWKINNKKIINRKLWRTSLYHDLWEAAGLPIGTKQGKLSTSKLILGFGPKSKNQKWKELVPNLKIWNWKYRNG